MPTKPRPRAPKVSPLAYEDRLDARPLSQVDLVVIHCTELPDLAIAREYGERVLHTGSGTGNSGHYYVDRNGDCHRFVAPDRVAHHVRGYNPRSIGIALVNAGHWTNWPDSRPQALGEAFPDAQIDTPVVTPHGSQGELPHLTLSAHTHAPAP